jgi:hypothetical protein
MLFVRGDVVILVSCDNNHLTLHRVIFSYSHCFIMFDFFRYHLLFAQVKHKSHTPVVIKFERKKKEEGKIGHPIM